VNRQTQRYLMALLAIASLGIASFAQSTPISKPASIDARVLLIDETRTFASTMRVGALAGILRHAGVDLEVRLENVASSYVDPLADIDAPDVPFDLILIVPIGIEDGMAPEVWLLHSGSASSSSEAQAGIAALRGVLAAVFDGLAEPVGVLDDLWVGLLASQYAMEGWLR